ncbi:MAG: transglutaminase-like domain-containing protein, partial [Gammaproteobacteria bacterium]|nr:transglutaminase-like domain-containing protein [Gammaproteobacteria bacterium]
MNAFLKTTFVSLVLSSFIFVGNTIAAPRDSAPIPEETIRAIIGPYSHNRPNDFDANSTRHIEDILSLLSSLEQSMLMRRNATETVNVASKKAFLLGKISELKTLQENVNTHYLGTLKSASAVDASHWTPKQNQVRERIETLINHLETIVNSSARRESIRKIRTAKRYIKELQRDTDKNENKLAKTIKPTFRQETTEMIPPSTQQAPTPAYLAINDAAKGMYAYAGGIVLSDAPSQPVAPAPEVSACVGYSQSNDLGNTNDANKNAPEIIAQAAKLGYSAAKIFQFVSNEIDFQPYYGSLKGAVGTLISGSGNATDQSSLLVALLRASQIPARYVQGTVVLTADQANRWVGGKTASASATILARGRIPAGASGDSTQVSMEHVWVQACVPYGNYRGTSIDMAGHRWIPLDPSFEDKTYTGGISVNVTFDYNEYLSVLSQKLPQEKLEEQIAVQIKSMAPHFENNSITDVIPRAYKNQLMLDILPASLPYFVNNFVNWPGLATAETHEIPDAHRYKLDIGYKRAAD